PQALLIVPIQRPRLFQHRRVWDLTYADAELPIRRADRDETRVAAGSALELGVADSYQCPRFRHHIEIAYAFRLRVAVIQEPGFAFQLWRGVRIERLVSV